MASPPSPLREAAAQASRTQAELERRLFQLKYLQAAADEFSNLTQPRRIIETFLLTALGLFGAAHGLALMVNTQTGQGTITQRGLSPAEAEACERNLSRIAEHYLPEERLPRRAELLAPGPEPDPGLLPADTALVLTQRVDGTYALLSAFGPRLSGEAFGAADKSALLNLADTLAGALSQNLFHREIQHLNAGLMRQGQVLEQAQRDAAQARERLDLQIFHLQTLYDFTRDLSPLSATDKLLESLLLTVMGTFGAGRGCVLLCDRESGRARWLARGVPEPRRWTFEQAEKLIYRGFQATEERRLEPMTAGFILDPAQALPEAELGFCARTAALFTVDETLFGLLALGPLISQPALPEASRELLRGLTINWMAFLKNARAFETIQALNADLHRTNADLRRTIAELTEARDRIRLLEVAKNRLRQVIRREVEQAGRFRWADLLGMLIIAAVLALVFNASSPHGIPLLPESFFETPAPRIDALTAHGMLTRKEAVLVDARPPELFNQRHIAGAVNIPAALFDVIFPMKLGPTLTPEQVVLIYGSTLSKRYDEELARRLLERHEQVRILGGGLSAWDASGLEVAP
ncbi:MAG: rhodanese-like domain-containing protein [Desulfobacterales bacterium]|jgi:rhodanese-related sulfurtransferase|nr:rhodanese-like domain-containing protein [Desulfobacterales bacterium]